MGRRRVYRRRRRQRGAGVFRGKKRQRGRRGRGQRGGFGGALAAGMLIPQLLNTTGQILKVSV